MPVPFFAKPQLVPINLVLISLAAFVLVWAIYLPVRFVVNGFGSASKPTVKNPKKEAPPVETQSEPQPQFAHGMWRN